MTRKSNFPTVDSRLCVDIVGSVGKKKKDRKIFNGNCSHRGNEVDLPLREGFNLVLLLKIKYLCSSLTI